MDESPRYAVVQVVGEEQAETFVQARLTLPAAAREILETRRSVLVDHTDLALESAILQGRLRVTYIYAGAEETGVWKGPASLAAPGEVVRVGFGPLLVYTADVGFAMHLRIPGAAPGMTGRLVSAGVSAETQRPVEITHDGLIAAILDQSAVTITLRVLREVEVSGLGACIPAPPAQGNVTRFGRKGR